MRHSPLCAFWSCNQSQALGASAELRPATSSGPRLSAGAAAQRPTWRTPATGANKQSAHSNTDQAGRPDTQHVEERVHSVEIPA